MTINHNDVYDFLHGLRKDLGIDLISQPKMVQMHGKTYPTVGNTLHLDSSDTWGSINIRIPHENGYLTEIHSTRDSKGNSAPWSLINDMVPGTRKTKSGLTRNTFNFGESGVNREGPYNMDSDGILRRNKNGAEKHFHDFIKDISNKSSPQGHAVNNYGYEGNEPIPKDQMKGFDLLDAVGHMREWDLGMTMPKGTEHHLGVASSGDGQMMKKYLYDIGSESLTQVPEEMHTKFGDVG